MPVAASGTGSGGRIEGGGSRTCGDTIGSSVEVVRIVNGTYRSWGMSWTPAPTLLGRSASMRVPGTTISTVVPDGAGLRSNVRSSPWKSAGA